MSTSRPNTARSTAKRVVFQAMHALRVPSLSRWLLRNRLLILMFHGFTDRTHSGLENYDFKHLDISRFEGFLRCLKNSHTLIPLSQAVEFLTRGRELPANSTVLTFDDGYASNFHLAFPILQKYQAPATVFLATEFVDCKKPLWPDRLDTFSATQFKAFSSTISSGDSSNVP